MRIRAMALVGMLLAPALAGCLQGGEPSDPTPPVDGARFGPFPPVDLSQVQIANVMVASFDGTELAVTVFRPPHATAENPVPVILHSNYFSGQRWHALGPDARFPRLGGNPDPFLKVGFGVVSMEQRGSGDSGGVDQNFLSELYDARDVLGVVDHLASFPWVARDAPGDPVVGMVGFSYGAIVQILATLYETREAGATRIDAIAPFAFELEVDQSINPNGVPRSIWWDLLVYAADRYGMRTSPELKQQYAYHMVTGSPMTRDGPNPRSAATFVDQAVLLDVPALLLAGAHDSRFEPGEVLRFYQHALTPAARAESMVALQRYGHTIPEAQVLPTVEPCEEQWGGDVWGLTVQWHRRHLLGEALDFGYTHQLATETDCLLLDAIPRPAWTAVPGTALAQTPVSLRATPPHALLPITTGPVTLAGVPLLNFTATVAPPGARVFFALAAGPSADNVRVLGDQWMPMELGGPGEVEVLELGGVASSVQADETLYLVVARWVDQFAHHHDRVPGPVVLEAFEVGLPLVEEEAP